MSNEEQFLIKDLEQFVNASRRLVFQNLGSQTETNNILDKMSLDEEEEMDDLLSYEEALSIIKPFFKKQINKKTKEYRYLLNEDIYISMITALNDRLVSNVLNSLVNKGLIETAYDEKCNDFIFWVANNDKTSNEKPETD